MCIGYRISGTLVPKYQEKGLSILHPMRKISNSKNNTRNRNYREPRGIYQTIAITLNLNIFQKDLLNSMLLKNAGSK